MKWTLEEAVKKMFPETGVSEIGDDGIGISAHTLTMEVSIAIAEREGEETGLSVLLSLPEQDMENEEDLNFWHFGTTIYPRENESLATLFIRFAKELKVEPNSPIWVDGLEV